MIQSSESIEAATLSLASTPNPNDRTAVLPWAHVTSSLMIVQMLWSRPYMYATRYHTYMDIDIRHRDIDPVMPFARANVKSGCNGDQVFPHVRAPRKILVGMPKK